jgi:hypothetical protein
LSASSWSSASRIWNSICVRMRASRASFSPVARTILPITTSSATRM